MWTMPQEATEMPIAKPKPLSEYQTPWEAKETDFDPQKGKEFVHYLHTEAWNALEREKAEKKRADGLQTQLDAKQREGEDEQTTKDRELREANERAEKAEKATKDALKWKVGLEKGLTATQAARLIGDTEEELTADADKLRTDLGITDKADDDEDGGDGGDTPRVTPTTKLRNSGDPAGDTPNFDVDKEAEAYMARSRGF
jgi:hypothetical protein